MARIRAPPTNHVQKPGSHLLGCLGGSRNFRSWDYWIWVPGHVLRGCVLSNTFFYLSLYFLVTMKHQLCSPCLPCHDTLFHHSLKRLELAEQKLKPETMSHNDFSSFKFFCQKFLSVRRADQYSKQ